MENVKTLVLEGYLKDIFGERHEGVFEDTRGALLMMARRHENFLSCIRGDYHVIFKTGEMEVLIGEDELHLPATTADEIILVPIPDGSNKGKGGVKIIAAIALVALSFIVPGGGVVLTAALWATAAVLFVGGVTKLMSPSPQLESADKRIENADSYLFNSTSNVDQDGYAEPLALGGPILCGSHVASSGIEVIELINADTNNSVDPTFPNYGYPQFDSAIGGLKSSKGGGSTARAAREAPNTYQTEAVAKLVEIISSGEIEGFVYPANPFRNVYLDRTPIQNEDLSFNMRGVEMQNRWGLAEQDHLSGFDEVSNPVSVNVKVLFGTNNTVTRTLANNPSAPLDRVVVNLRWNAMTEQNTENGDLNGSSVSYKIYLIPNGGSAQTVVDTTFAQKFTSPTEKSYSIPLPVGGHPYQVRVERTSPDAASISVQNDMFFSSYSEIVDAKLTHPMRAVVGLKAYARLFGDSIPERGYLLKGVITEVPVNYDPDTRVYTGVWNGTFKMAWTNNPVWILWGLLTNKTWGLGNQIPRTVIDRYSFYGPAVVADQTVTDGKGGTEPKYTYSKWLRERQSAMSFLQAVASSFRGKLIWGKGGIMLTQDTIKNPVRIVTNANVIDGVFTYSQVAEEDIRTVAYCSYIEPSDGWKETLVVAENSTLLATKGRRPRNVVAEGTTSARQALELGRWVVFSEQYNDELLTFKGYYDLADILPGNVIMVSDVNEIGYRHGGRLVSCTTTGAVMDSAFQFQSGVTYTVHITMADGTLQSRTLNGTGSTNTASISWTTPLPATPLGNLNTVFCITSTQIAPSLWSVESISEEDGEDGIISFLCVKYTTAKFTAIDSNLTVPETPTSLYDPAIRPAPVTGITLSRVLVSERAGNIEKIQVKFTASDSVFVKDYKIQYRYKNGVWTEFVSPSDNAEIPYQGEGVYEVIVTANDFLNRTSVGVSASQTFTGRARTIATLANLRVTGAAPGVTTFAESELRVEWDVIAPSGIVDASYEDPYFRDYVVEVRKGAVLLGTYYTTQRNFRLTEQLNARISGTGIPEPTLTIDVRLRDTDGNLSGAISQTFTNPVPSAPTGILVTPGLSEANIRVPIPTNVSDFTRILVWTYASTFDQTQAPTYITTEADIRVPLTAGSTLKARVAYADSFTRANNAWSASTELTLSTRVTTTTELPVSINNTVTEVQNARRSFGDLLASVSNAALTASWTNITSRPLNLNDLDTTAQTDVTNTKNEVVAARGTFGTVAARIGAEETTRASADSALAGRATVLEAKAISNQQADYLSNGQFLRGTVEWIASGGLGVAPLTPEGISGRNGVAITLIAGSGVQYYETQFAWPTWRTTDLAWSGITTLWSGGTNTGAGIRIYIQGRVGAGGWATIAQTSSITDIDQLVTPKNLRAQAAPSYDTLRLLFELTPPSSGSTLAFVLTQRVSNWTGEFPDLPMGPRALIATEARIATEETTRANADSALATRSTTLETSFRFATPTAINKNPTFASWTGTLPDDWVDWSNGTTNLTKVSGDRSPFAYRQTNPAGNLNYGIQQIMSGKMTLGWYVLEAEVTLNSGSLTGAAVHLNWGVSAVTNSDQIVLTADPDNTGSVVGAGTVGRRYRFSKLINITVVPNISVLYAMTTWQGVANSGNAKDLTWHSCLVRQASDSEIELRSARGASASVGARITTEEGTRAAADSALALRSDILEAKTAPQNVNNLLTNSNFAGRGDAAGHSLVGWVEFGSTGYAISQFYQNQSFVQIGGTTAVKGIYQDVEITGEFAVGTDYWSISALMRSTGNGGCRIYMQWLDETRTISYGYSPTVDLTGNSGWQYVKLEQQVRPASARWVRVHFDNNSVAFNSGNIYQLTNYMLTRTRYAFPWTASGEIPAMYAAIKTEELARASGDSANVSSITTLTARINANPNLFPAPTPVNGQTPTQQGWIGTPISSIYASNVGGLVYYKARGSGGSAVTEYFIYDIPNNVLGSADNWTVSACGYGGGNVAGDRLGMYIEAWDPAISTRYAISPIVYLNDRSLRVGTSTSYGGAFLNPVTLRVVFYREWPASGSYQDVVFNMVKVEAGTTMTAYTNTAQIINLNQVSVEARGRAYAISGTQTEVNGRKGGFVMDNNGEVTNFQITADDFRIYQSVGGANLVPFRVVGGQTQINDALIRTLSVVPDGGGPSHRVQLRPNSVSGADGATFTFSPAYGGIPLIRPVILQPPALAAGETYDISATALSASGFTIRAKKFTAGTPTAQSSGAGSNVGGTPAWQAAKPTTADADGNSYTFSWTATIPRVSNEFMGSNQYYAEYFGEFDVYYNSGSGWVYAYTAYLSYEGFYTGSSPTSLTGQVGTTTAVLPAIGQHGGNEFGLHAISGTITAFAGVSYTTTSQSSVTALPGNFTFDIYAPT